MRVLVQRFGCQVTLVGSRASQSRVPSVCISADSYRVSDLGLRGRYGLGHCRIRLHRQETCVRGASAIIVGYSAFVMQRRIASCQSHGQFRGYMNGIEGVASSLMDVGWAVSPCNECYG